MAKKLILSKRIKMKPISEKTLDELNTTKTLIRTISNGTNDSFKKFSTEPINTTYSPSIACN